MSEAHKDPSKDEEMQDKAGPAGESEDHDNDGQLSEEVGKRRRLDSGSSVTPPQDVAPSSSRHREESVAASPPRFMNLDDIMKMANGVTDLSLAHEIAVNDDFRLETVPHQADSSLEGCIRHVVSKAFWDVLEEKLRTEPDDHSYSLKLLEDVKSSLLDLLLPQHVRLRAQIEEVLDLSLIEQKAEHGGVDFLYYADYVIGIMSMLCAPVRDEQIAALRRETDIVTIYKQICEILAQMKLDMVNFTISQLRPILKQHSAEYERNKFNSLLDTQRENGVDGLQFTRHWLKGHYNKFLASNPGLWNQTAIPTGAGNQIVTGSGTHTAASHGVGRQDDSVQSTSSESLPSSSVKVSEKTALVSGSSTVCTSSATVPGTAGTTTATATAAAVSVSRAAAAGTSCSLPEAAAAASDTAASAQDHAAVGGASGPDEDWINHSIRKIVNSAYVELLDWDPSRVYPETMLVDMKRLSDLQDSVLTLTLVSSVLAVTYSTVGALLRDLTEFKVTLKQHVMVIIGNAENKNATSGNAAQRSAASEVPDDVKQQQQHQQQQTSDSCGQSSENLDEIMSSVAEQVGHMTCQSLQKHGYTTPTQEHLRVLKGQIQSLANPENPIRKVMRTRICGFVLSILSPTPDTRTVQIPPGYTALQDELRRTCESFIRVVSYNYAVYSQHYRNIITQLSSSCQAE